MRVWTLTLLALPLTACQPGEIPVVECGDGVVDVTEPCDDANLVDGDGCSATCEVEQAPAPECFPILESVETRELSTHVTPDGRVVFAGKVQTAGQWGAWVGAVDIDGTLLWSFDFGPAQDPYATATGIGPRGDGFMFIHYDVETDLVTIDGSGNILETVTLDRESLTLRDLLEVDGELLFSGTANAEDAWLGRLGQAGTFETLATLDYLGFYDSLSSLRRQGEVIGALAMVGVANHGDGDAVAFDIVSTLLVEYDEQGIEQRRTLLSSGDDHLSLRGSFLDITDDGTWIVAGMKGYRAGDLIDEAGWAAAVRDGEVVWTFESSGTVEHHPTGAFANLYTGVVAQNVLLAGQVKTNLAMQPWAVRLNGATGGLEAEFVGPAAPVPDELSIYTGAGMTSDGRVWLVGSTFPLSHESEAQWLCSTSF